jgi:hypothetical protein
VLTTVDGDAIRDPRDADARRVWEAARAVDAPRVYGQTRSRRLILDAEVELLAAETRGGL